MKVKNIARLMTIPVLVLIIVTLMVINDSSLKQKPRLVVEAPVGATETLSTREYTDAVQKKFSADHVEPTINKIYEGTYHIPAIQERYNFLFKEVERRYGGYSIQLINGFATESQEISFGCFIKDGKAYLDIIMPKQIEIFEELRASGIPNWQEVFQYHIMLNFMHELEHIAGDPEELDQINDLGALVRRETLAWDRTCRYEIRPLIDHAGASAVTRSAMIFYDGWLATGKDADSKAWADFIIDKYGYLRDK